MVKHFLIPVFVVLCGAIGAMAQPKPAENYQVTFDGIIMHNLTVPSKERALIVRGTDDMPHQAILVTPPDIDKTKMLAAIGKQYNNCTPQDCRFHIESVALRVGTADPQTPAPGPLSPPDDTFVKYTPHMSCVTRGTLYSLVYDDLPSGPVSAFFELVGGKLSACTFSGDGFFSPDYDQESKRKFTDKVTLTGTVPAGTIATVQVRSYLTKDKWVTVPRIGGTPQTPLVLRIENHANVEKGKMPPSNKHFAINGQLIEMNTQFPSVCPSKGGGDDANCPSQPYYSDPRPSGPNETCLPPPLSSGDVVYDCKPASSKSVASASVKQNANASVAARTSTTHMPSSKSKFFDLIAGCANSTWP